MNIIEVTGKIPVPPLSEFLVEEFMRPMGITVNDLSKGAGISLPEAYALVQDKIKVTPELSKKLGTFFGISENIFYRLQQDIDRRNARMKFDTADDEFVHELALA